VTLCRSRSESGRARRRGEKLNGSLVLASTLAFLVGGRSRNSVCITLEGTGPLPRSGGLVSRSLPCVNNPTEESRIENH
jgi:hypothetical protein